MTISDTKSRSLLQAVAFGESVAEYDHNLSNYFVETSTFLDIAADRSDLILGDKGTGKSAIFYHLANSNAEIPQLASTDILPAFNVQGSVIFRRLTSYKNLPEEAYRFIWSTFIIAMIANHIVYSYGPTTDVSEIVRTLKRADLRTDAPSALRLWDKIELLIESIVTRLETEGELEFGIPKLPIKAKVRGRIRGAKPDAPAEEPNEVDLEQLLYQCNEVYETVNRNCWLLFDRLDEAFEQNRELESLALRGLLRAHIDLASFRLRLRTKLFLRNDVLDRVTRYVGFVNATHLRKQTIQWDSDAALDLIARRIASSSQVIDFFQFSDHDLRDHLTRQAICSYIVPEHISHLSLIEWIHVNTSDSTETFNPRNIIDLLTFARQRQLGAYDRDDPAYDAAEPLISSEALEGALDDLSEARLHDTVLAEFPTLRGFIEAVMRSPHGAQLNYRIIANLLNCNPGSSEYHAGLATLSDAGLVKITSSDKIVIARLYRRALRINRRHTEIAETELADLRELVDLAVRGEGKTGLRLPLMNDAERKYVHQYVTTHYSDEYTTYSVPGPRHGMKNVILRPLK